LLSALRADQSVRWQRGDRVRVEKYLEEHPELGSDPEALLDLVYAELLLRLEGGEVPSLEEYLDRLPQHAESLLRRWSTFCLAHPELAHRPDATTSEAVSHSSQQSLFLFAPAGLFEPLGFEIQRELGRGGMGIVFEAREVSLNRMVALKVINAHPLVSEHLMARFQTEVEAIARLDHPGVARIFSSGCHEGLLYFWMELVPGGNLAFRLRRGPLGVREAAELARQLALAVAHAHERGVLHRDLKPGNVLLTREGVPKVSDFGLAKLLETDDGQTQTGTLLGTPTYMAPEQATGRTHDVGRATDVWALGVILYECLTGKTPFKGVSRTETLERVKTQRPIPPRKLRPEVHPDLETICLKCLRKEPAKRYQTADDLAEDLARWQQGKPVLARPQGRTERAWRWTRSNLLVLGLLTTGVLLLAIVAAVADPRRQDAGVDPPVLEQPAKKKGPLTGQLLRTIEGHGGNVSSVAISRDGNRIVSGSWGPFVGEKHGPGEVKVWNAMTGEELFSLEGHKLPVYCVAISADGSRIVSGSGEPDKATPGELKVWDALTGKELFSLKGHKGDIRSVAFSTDGARIVSGGSDRTVKVWDAGTRQNLHTLTGHTRDVSSVAISADGKRIVSGSLDRMAKVWDARTGKHLRTLEEHEGYVLSVAISNDGKQIVAGGGFLNGEVKIHDTQMGKVVLSLGGHTSEVRGVTISTDGRHIVSASLDKTVKLWDASTGKELLSLAGHSLGPNSVAISRDGKRIVSGGSDKTVKVWDPAVP
jgi:WD40 repeat protein